MKKLLVILSAAAAMALAGVSTASARPHRGPAVVIDASVGVHAGHHGPRAYLTPQQQRRLQRIDRRHDRELRRVVRHFGWHSWQARNTKRQNARERAAVVARMMARNDRRHRPTTPANYRDRDRDGLPDRFEDDRGYVHDHGAHGGYYNY